MNQVKQIDQTTINTFYHTRRRGLGSLWKINCPLPWSSNLYTISVPVCLPQCVCVCIYIHTRAIRTQTMQMLQTETLKYTQNAVEYLTVHH